ncbi:MAG: hypothetical protein K8I27_16615 [Planctomycetes bacterium]|nr:hypothetical protein [Planctomycetota bacterium]
MKPLFAALAGFALIGAIGATQVHAQRGHTSTRSENFRKPVQTPKSGGHYITVQKKVWVPGHYITEHKDVWVPGHYDVVRERRVDACGVVFYVSVKKFHPGHYECREVRTFVPGCYKITEERVWVEDRCDPCDEHGHGGGHGKATGSAGHGQKGKKRNRRHR